LAFANQLPLPAIVQAAGSGIAALSSAIEVSDLYLYLSFSIFTDMKEDSNRDMGYLE